ncbi:hypothetical protein HY501_03435 [Candidatus Woesearchaeota archaeon]|nr:hypothetical protein [Candidatus Woesearchaeota archaeon]
MGKILTEQKWKSLLPEIREDAIKRSRAVLGGQFSEQLAPYLPDFPYSPTEARFLGRPVDFLVFKGMDGKEISEIVFVEVKSGKSSLNKAEKSLRNAVVSGKVAWEEYRIPENLTKERR